MRDLKLALAQRKADHLYRSRRVVEGPQGAVITVEGQHYLNFCSNDYLGLASDARLAEAMKRGADEYGVGAGAAHLINGHSHAHHALEEELAAFTGRERALLFSTGYMANLGTIAALCGAGDAVFEDRWNHASLLDGGLLSRARLARYAHADSDALAARLGESKAENRLVVTDGVFSMDGDIAPLPQLAAVAQQNDAWLMVDDAHGLGVIGEQGKGSCAYHSMTAEQVPILMGTLGKGFGTFGAFVAGSEDLIETLINTSRPYIYTTAMPAAIAEATRTSLAIIQQEQWRRDQLQTLVQRFRSGAEQLGLQLMPSQTAIQPLLVGDAGQAVAISKKLEQKRLLISAIRPPTVPEGTARLRITLTAGHSEAQIDQLLQALGEVMGNDMESDA